MNDQIERFKELNENLKNLSEKKIRFEEQFKTKKQSLAELIREIKEAGYDPIKLNEAIQEKETALKKAIAKFEKELQEVSSQLSEIEAA